MKKSNLCGFILLTLLLTACGSASSPTTLPTVVLGNENAPVNQQTETGGAITASGVVVPIRESRLAFASIGKVTEVNVKVGDSVKAGDVLVALDTALLQARVKEAQANLASAAAQVAFLKRNKTDQVHLDEANANVERMQALLDSANAALAAQSTLVAPFDGIIVEVNITPAEIVTPGQIVIVLGDLSQFQVETTDLSERDVTKIQHGQTATIFIEALNDEFTGIVADVSLVSSTLGGDVVYTVTLDFEDQPDGLRWGMSADVTFDE
jgi:RND family efflux transporter MFP subunit